MLMRALAFTERADGVAKRGSLASLGSPVALAKSLPFGIGDRAGGDVAVAGLEHEIGPVVGIGRGRLGADDRVLHHAFRPQIRDHGIQHRHLDVLALPGFLARIERGADGLGGEHRRGLVADDGPDHLRTLGDRLRLDIGKAGEALDDRVIDPLLDIGTAVADAADRDVDQPRKPLAQFLDAEAKPLHGAGAKILHQHVRLRDQFGKHLAAAVGLDIDRERTLAAIGRDEQRREFAALVDGGGLRRVMSPPIGSILRTSAPWSARNMVAYGPDTTPVRSRTRTPLSGPAMSILPFCCSALGIVGIIFAFDRLIHRNSRRLP